MMPTTALSSFVSEPAFGACLTLIAYAVALVVNKRFPVLPILIITCGLIIGAILGLGIPYASYKIGGAYVSFFLSPAVVALAVPFYRQVHKIGRDVPVVVVSSAIGSGVGLVTAYLLSRFLQLSPEIARSTMVPFATAPIGMDLVRQLGGVPELAALSSVMCGLTGSIIGPTILHRLFLRAHLPTGTGIGTASHGIGTARMLRVSHYHGSVSGLAMASTGIITTLWVELIRFFGF